MFIVYIVLGTQLDFLKNQFFHKDPFTLISQRQEFQTRILIIEPWHGISNNVVCMTSKASDQPAHTRRLIRAFASLLSIL